METRIPLYSYPHHTLPANTRKCSFPAFIRSITRSSSNFVNHFDSSACLGVILNFPYFSSITDSTIPYILSALQLTWTSC